MDSRFRGNDGMGGNDEMRLRSLLFVPGDRPDRMEKALRAGADALILDLEDAVAPASKPEARRQVAEFLNTHSTAKLWVRINPLDSDESGKDLAAILSSHPDGIVLPKAEGGASVAELTRRLTSQGNATAQILAIATETPAAMFQLGTYGGAKRLAGLTWGAEDLPAAIGAATSREPDGRFTPPYELARSLCLFGAAAAGVAPIETVYPAFRDLDGLAAFASRARRDGFTGMMAIHPDQVPVINAAFTPSEAEIAHARAVVAAFEANPGAGALALDGKMIDRPHLVQAQRTLAAAAGP
jgi:citrate lyase subunit beta/citryl-CoA lyase